MGTHSRKRLGRELLLLTMPIAALLGFALWHQRPREEQPPENLEFGAPRVVVGGWKEVAPTPFDLYRGYEQKWQVPVWVGGKIPPFQPSGKPVTRSYRQAQTDFPLPQLFYRQGTQWHMVKSKFHNPEVKIDGADSTQELRDKMLVELLVRFDRVPKSAQEIALRGKFGARVEDREVQTVMGVPTDTSTDYHALTSTQISRSVQRPPKNLQSFEAPIVARWQEWNSFDYGQHSQFSIKFDFEWKQKADQSTAAPRFAIFGGQILDANGRIIGQDLGISWETLATDSRRGWGWLTRKQSVPLVASVGFAPETSAREKWQWPLTFQGAISVDGSWPLELSVELNPSDNGVKTAVKPSSRRFDRKSVQR